MPLLPPPLPLPPLLVAGTIEFTPIEKEEEEEVEALPDAAVGYMEVAVAV